MNDKDRQNHIESFVNDLGNYHADMTFNPWSETNDLFADYQGPQGRRNRLIAHMSCEPFLILLGDGAGFQGCATSGIPFTSERLIMEGAIPRVKPTGRLSGRPRPWSEPSASIMWRTLYEIGIAETKILWNAFPWHPHGPGNPASNRTPLAHETQIGGEWLDRLMSIYKDVPLVAVGKTSERLVKRLGINLTAAVRHPAWGGAPHFKNGIAELLAG